MRITFDDQYPLTGISLTPWMRVGPDRWFKNYTIITQDNWDPVFNDSCRIIPLGGRARLNNAFVKSPQVTKALLKHVAPGIVLTSHPTQPPAELTRAGYCFFAMNQQLHDTLENKAYQRQWLGKYAPFPPFIIKKRAELTPDRSSFEAVAVGRSGFVIQDDTLASGRGTCIIRNLQDYKKALFLLRRSRKVVISDLIENAAERSVQACVTKHGIVVGPLQKQIVRDEQLANLRVEGSERFCGGEISQQDPLAGSYTEITRIAKIVGQKLQDQGYRGIFGLDFLVRKDGGVHLLELNPRFTGLTPLATHLWRDERDVPLYLLHILETCGMPYELAAPRSIDSLAEGSMLALYNQQDFTIQLPGLQSGLYRYDPAAQTVRFIRSARHFAAMSQNGDFLLERRQPDDWRYSPGKRFAKLYFNRRVLDDADTILPEIRDIVAAVYSLADSVSIRT
jgi:hypothetical protein